MGRHGATDYDALGVPEAGCQSLEPGLWLTRENGLHCYREKRGTSILLEDRSSARSALS